MTKRSLITLLVLAALCPAVSFADTGKLLAMAAEKTDGALAVLSFKVTGELRTQPVAGVAFCIKPSGLFISMAFNAVMRPEDLSDFELRSPGLGGKKVKAKFIGIDPETGIGFVQSLEGQKWKALELAERADLQIGQGVASAGLLPEDTGHALYVGAAYVSSVVRVPEKQVYVTGGKLTAVGSPVLTEDGRVVGIVQRQLPIRRQFIPTDRGPVPVRTTAERETSFFLPIEELQPVIANAGKQRKLSWIGAVSFNGVTESAAKIMQLDRPGVQIDKLVPDTPAWNAKLKNRDVIVGVNGRPVERLGMPALTARNLERSLVRLPPGTGLRLSIFRNEKVFDVSIKTAAMPTMPYQAERYYSKDLGFGVRRRVMIDDYLDSSPATKTSGVIIYLVLRNSPAATAQLKGNDVVASMAGAGVTTIDAFKGVEQRILADESLSVIELVVMRGDREEKLRLKLPERRGSPK